MDRRLEEEVELWVLLRLLAGALVLWREQLVEAWLELL